GLLELERGEPAAARARFQEAVRRDARCAPAYVDLAILQGEREPDEALANLRRALAARADYLPALNQMALLYLAQAGAHRELLDLAEMVCRQAQLVDPDWAPLYNTWALIDLERAELTAAAAKLTRATVLDPSFFEAHMNLGQLLLSQRAYEDAAAAFERARGLRPSSYDAILGHGVAQRGLRRIADAEASYMAAIEADAARPEAYFDLGVLYMDHRDGTGEDLSRAAGFFRQFVERARARPALASTVADVERRCDAAPAGRGGGRARSACRPGRLQLIEIAAATMDTMRRQEERPGEPQSQSQ
ncbi:MAG: tetratricopeptide repeat protein, partial [Sandaracinaceae bacterium]|nr:tetratricopeptide repeat protein [Sandaracinaceae bacterium]